MGRRNRGRNRRARQRLLPVDFEVTFEALSKESDRGAVLIGAQMLQDRLETVLHTLFTRTAVIPYSVPSREQLERLLFNLISSEAWDVPLARSGPRLMVCRALGLLGDYVCDGIEGIQRIRNHFFAHYTGPVSLSDPLVRRALSDLYDALPDYEAVAFEEREEWWKKQKRRYSEARLFFMTMTDLLYLRIGDAFQEIFERFIPLEIPNQ